ncbi:hypothetical protein MKW98_019421 [Papaver atlanticum]|uniref:Uncharacterized protein n=1 Tax=Papaver atlanticum TaxID=357466 RepID=A0AAD4S8B0_9MAGN|nr:hypothetical protein MKW98_019421 [Papaver atlanticum]
MEDSASKKGKIGDSSSSKSWSFNIPESQWKDSASKKDGLKTDYKLWRSWRNGYASSCSYNAPQVPLLTNGQLVDDIAPQHHALGPLFDIGVVTMKSWNNKVWQQDIPVLGNGDAPGGIHKNVLPCDEVPEKVKAQMKNEIMTRKNADADASPNDPRKQNGDLHESSQPSLSKKRKHCATIESGLKKKMRCYTLLIILLPQSPNIGRQIKYPTLPLAWCIFGELDIQVRMLSLDVVATWCKLHVLLRNIRKDGMKLVMLGMDWFIKSCHCAKCRKRIEVPCTI